MFFNYGPLSPSGQSVFYNRGDGFSGGSLYGFGGGGMDVGVVFGQTACLWINDSSILSLDAVVAYPSGAVTALPAAGTCAGRFPGLL